MSLMRSYSTLSTTFLPPSRELAPSTIPFVKSLSFNEHPGRADVKPCTGAKFSTRRSFNAKMIVQAGGRDKGFRVHQNDWKILYKDTSQDEKEFYESIAPKLDVSVQSDWAGWRPKFLGSVDFIDGNGKQKASIALENLSARTANQNDKTPGLFRHPNIIDIKLGQRLYRDSDPPRKISVKKERARESTSGLFGARLSGAQVWNNSQKQYMSYDKKFGLRMDARGIDLQKNFNSFFPISSHEDTQKEELTFKIGGLSKDFLRRILDESVMPQLKELIEHVSKFKWRCYNSSLLVVIEGDRDRLEFLMKLPNIKYFTHVKMIDFAGVEIAEDADEGLLKGLETTLGLFQKLLTQLDEVESAAKSNQLLSPLTST